MILIDGENVYKFLAVHVDHSQNGGASLSRIFKGFTLEEPSGPKWADYFPDHLPVSIKKESIESGNVYVSKKTIELPPRD